MPRKKNEVPPAAVPAVVAAEPHAPSVETPVGPQFVADAGAAFQQDRSGSPRGREITEGAANFAAFSQSIRDSAKGAE